MLISNNFQLCPTHASLDWNVIGWNRQQKLLIMDGPAETASCFMLSSTRSHLILWQVRKVIERCQTSKERHEDERQQKTNTDSRANLTFSLVPAEGCGFTIKRIPGGSTYSSCNWGHWCNLNFNTAGKHPHISIYREIQRHESRYVRLWPQCLLLKV